MIEAPISTPPQAYMDIISSLIDQARDFLEAGEKLQALAFVGNLTTKESIPVMIQPGSGEDKDLSAREIQSAASALDADFVFVIMEAWALRPDKMRQMDAILNKFGSIGASPYAIDVCVFSLETRRGIWASQPQIKPKGISKRCSRIPLLHGSWWPIYAPAAQERRRRVTDDFTLGMKHEPIRSHQSLSLR